MSASTPDGERIRVGISSCLLGHAVRHDGGHKHDRYLTDVLGRWFEYVPFCPEVAAGLGTPRPPIRLVGDPAAPRALGVRDPDLDPTDALAAHAREAAIECRTVSGYLFKRGSPSCGMERVKVYAPDGMPNAAGRGIYAAELMRRLPLMPVEEEGRLNDPVLRESFVTRVFAYHRWQRMSENLSPGALVDFHTRHKLLLLAHSEVHYRRLGPLVARAGSEAIEPLAARYVEEFMAGLAQRATRRRHTNVLQHVMGYLKRDIDAEDKAELVTVIGRYRRGEVPLVVPLTLLRHHFRRNPAPYVDLQHYMHPHPDALMLRNAI